MPQRQRGRADAGGPAPEPVACLVCVPVPDRRHKPRKACGWVRARPTAEKPVVAVLVALLGRMCELVSEVSKASP